jgi:hypothetical protein
MGASSNVPLAESTHPEIVRPQRGYPRRSVHRNNVVLRPIPICRPFRAREMQDEKD